MNDWASFDAETAKQRALWASYLQLWRLEVISTRCAWQLWPGEATRRAYVFALSEREKCEAVVLALEGPDGAHAPWRGGVAADLN